MKHNENNRHIATNATLFEITKERLASEIGHLSSIASYRKIDVFRMNYDLWMTELKPVLIARKVAFYPVVVDLLVRVGFQGVTVNLVRDYLSRVKAERSNTAIRISNFLDVKANDELVTLTREVINSEMLALAKGDLSSSSLLAHFRANYDVWTKKLKPILRSKNKPFYPVLAQLLGEAGFGDVSVGLVGSYLNEVKKERGGHHAK